MLVRLDAPSHLLVGLGFKRSEKERKIGINRRSTETEHMALQSVFTSHLSLKKIAKYKSGCSNPHFSLPNQHIEVTTNVNSDFNPFQEIDNSDESRNWISRTRFVIDAPILYRVGYRAMGIFVFPQYVHMTKKTHSDFNPFQVIDNGNESREYLLQLYLNARTPEFSGAKFRELDLWNCPFVGPLHRVQNPVTGAGHNVPFFQLEKSPKRQNILSCFANSDIQVEASNSGENAKEFSTKIATQEKSNSDVDSVVETYSGENGLDSSTKIATQENVKEVVFNEEEPFRGKSGSISFSGLTHQLVEERKLVSSPFKDATGSLLWILGPISLLSSLLLPQFFLSNIDAVFGSELLAEIIVSFTNEIVFYIGCAVFLLTTDRVQRPYLEFSAKRWGLITGLRGYLTSAFFVMGFKLFAPLLLLYVVWPVIGIPAVLAFAPFIIGCCIQTMFEAYFEKSESSCWPLVPIVFEIYRLYQLTKAAHFIQTMIVAVRSSVMTPELVERAGALVSVLPGFAFNKLINSLHVLQRPCAAISWWVKEISDILLACISPWDPLIA
ncbi:hypothetical protein ACLOJK_002947 [Asimina triloba]